MKTKREDGDATSQYTPMIDFSRYDSRFNDTASSLLLDNSNIICSRSMLLLPYKIFPLNFSSKCHVVS